MGLGTAKQENKIFLSVGFGKIRQKTLENGTKVNAETPNAKLRKTQSGLEVWALEYDNITGVIENIFYKEDANYGNSFEVSIRSGLDLYQLSFSDDSRFWFDLASRLPNVDFKQDVKIHTFDFVSKDGKRVVGLRVKQNEQDVSNFYTKKENDKWVSIQGYPNSADVDWTDKDDIKLYTIKLKKYFKFEFNNRIFPKFSEHTEVPEHEINNTPLPDAYYNEQPDLPF